MFIKNFLSGKVCLTSVIIHKIQSFDETNKKVIGKTKDEFVGLKSKMYFNKFKDVLFNKKIIRHKTRRIQSKKHKLGTYL